jgi:hypothetical protein
MTSRGAPASSSSSSIRRKKSRIRSLLIRSEPPSAQFVRFGSGFAAILFLPQGADHRADTPRADVLREQRHSKVGEMVTVGVIEQLVKFLLTDARQAAPELGGDVMR